MGAAELGPTPAAASTSAVQSVGCVGRSTFTIGNISVRFAGCELAMSNLGIRRDRRRGRGVG
jgi:hypothetical protein